MKREKAILTVSCEPGGIILLCMACCCFFLPWLPVFHNISFWWGLTAFCWMCGLLLLTFSVVYGKKYSFSCDGIEHRILGVCFRKTAWKDVSSVMRLYTGDRSGSMGFLFTTKQGTIQKPDVRMPFGKAPINICFKNITTGKTPIDMCFKKGAFWHEWLVGKHFFVQQFSSKQEKEILSVLIKFYGELDYDVRQTDC